MVNKKVVVLGGGHGQSAILRGIKHIPDIDITAVVTVADDGGSTGRLRQFFNIPAMGDIRGVLIALAESETLLGTLMDYRFETNVDIDNPEQDVLGHNLGNLILDILSADSHINIWLARIIGLFVVLIIYLPLNFFWIKNSKN